MKLCQLILPLSLLMLVEGCVTRNLEKQSRRWVVGPTQGRIISTYVPEIGAELRCHGSHYDGKEWTKTKRLKSTISEFLSFSDEKKIRFSVEKGTLFLPSGNIKACSYLITTKGQHPNGGLSEGSIPIVGDIVLEKMKKQDLEDLLGDPELNLKISKRLENLKISH